MRRPDGDSALSPVIGVILLVAITVVLSATVFVVAGRFQEGAAEPGPHILMETDQGTQEVRVVRGDGDLDWMDLGFDGSCTPTLNGAPFPTASGQAVRAGDVLGCAAGEDLEITSSLDEGNALLYSTSFN
jgi:flagellin-like protein